MGSGIIRMAKVKASGLGGLQHHVDREGTRHANPDIDITRSDLNQAWVDKGEYEKFVTHRIAEGRKSTRAVRKDAVVLVDGIVTASPEDMARLTPKERGQFFGDALAFIRKEFGAENVAYFTIHADETTLHAHWGAVPLKDGTLSWKAYFPTKYALSAFQDRFHEQVSAKYGMDRGKKREPGEKARRHRTVEAMKKENQKELEKVQAEVEAANGRVRDAQVAARTAETKRDQVREELAAARRELAEVKTAKEHFELAAEYAKADLANLNADIAGAQDRLEYLRRAEASLEEECRSLEQRVEALVKRFVERVGRVIDGVTSEVAAILAEFGLAARAGSPLDSLISAASQYHRGREHSDTRTQWIGDTPIQI